MRRLVRDAIRKGPFTKHERDVTLAFFNHWLHHRSKSEIVHPGRQKLAKSAKTTEKTVSRTLGKLRAAWVIDPVSNLRGGHNTATRYRVNLAALFTLCGFDWVDQLVRGRLPNVPVVRNQMSRLLMDRMSHGIRDVGVDPSQDDYLPIEESLIDYSDDFGSDPDE